MGVSGGTLGAAKGAAKNIAQEVVDVAVTVGAVHMGIWNAETNVPAISDETGQNGWYYDVAVAGTWNGMGFLVGDTVKHNGTKWERIPTGIESNGPIIVKYLKNGDSLPRTRRSGSALKIGDSVRIDSHASLPLEIDGLVFNNYSDTAEWTGVEWQLSVISAGATSQIEVSNKEEESIGGEAKYQSEINKEVKAEFEKKENIAKKITDFDDLEEGDTESYPNANAVKNLTDKKVPKEREVAGKTLEQNITIQDIVNAFKYLARVYKNVTIDCDDNTLTNILVSCFKSSEVLTSMPQQISTETWKFVTAKAIFDFVTSKVQGAIKIKGKKQTKAEILALTDMEVNDEWRCEEDNHFWLYTAEDGWIDNGGAIDFSIFVLKEDIVDNLETNDSQKALSAAQGKKLKGLVDGKQDEIEINDLSADLRLLNQGVLIFTNSKLKTLLDMVVETIDCSLQAPLTNIVSGKRCLMKTPKLPNGYSYPTSTRINIRVPSGAYTCEENRHEFYDVDGGSYVSPNVGENETFSFESVANITDAYDENGNEIYIAEQIKDGDQLVIEKDGSPALRQETRECTQGAAENPKIFVKKFVAGTGYKKVDKYYNADGEIVEGTFYELEEVNIVFNLQYMYKCYLYNRMLSEVGRNFMINSSGQLVKVTITESQNSKNVKAKKAGVISSYFTGTDGTVIEEVINHSPNLTQIAVDIEPRYSYGYNEIEYSEDATHTGEGYEHDTTTNKWYLDNEEIDVNEVQELPIANESNFENYYLVDGVLSQCVITDITHYEWMAHGTNCVAAISSHNDL